jgi:hypothetical protein
MLIFNKRSASSSAGKGNKYHESTHANSSTPQSTLLRQDFIDLSNSFNNNTSKEDDNNYSQHKAQNGHVTNNGSNGNANSNSISTVDDTISIEEPHDDYVYQVI